MDKKCGCCIGKDEDCMCDKHLKEYLKDQKKADRKISKNFLKEPHLIDLKRFVDDRGILDAHYLPIKYIRSYHTLNQKGVIRAFHGHLRESKAILVLEGLVKVLVFSMKDENQQPSKMKTFVLSEHEPQILIVPKKFYHGYSTLSDKSIVFIFSNKTLEESQKDDYRLDALAFGENIWRARGR